MPARGVVCFSGPVRGLARGLLHSAQWTCHVASGGALWVSDALGVWNRRSLGAHSVTAKRRRRVLHSEVPSFVFHIFAARLAARAALQANVAELRTPRAAAQPAACWNNCVRCLIKSLSRRFHQLSQLLFPSWATSDCNIVILGTIY